MYDLKKMKKAITLFLEAVGDDPKREGLIETPDRVARFYGQVMNGYDLNPKDYIKTFEEKSDEMVIVKDIPLYSFCEHHLALFHGTLAVAYIPNGRVIGLSKLVRLARVFAKRPQIQERLTAQIANTLMEELNPLGVAVRIEAEHTCMTIRGVRTPGAKTVTTKLLGAFLTNPAVKSEFLNALK